MVRIAILGAGFMGGTHGTAYQNISNAEIAAVCDQNETLGRAFAEKYHCRYYSSFHQMLEECQFDVADICLPTFLHEEYVLMGARHRKHIFCEKPVALEVSSLERMMKAVKEAGVLMMVGQVLRFWPEYVNAKEMYEKGSLGELNYVFAARMSEHPAWSQWYRKPQNSGGGLLDLHLHDVDYLCWLLGRVKSVYASGKQNKDGCWNYVSSMLTFESGISASVQGVIEMEKGYPFTMELRLVGSQKTYEYAMKAGHNLEDVASSKRETRIYENGAITTLPVNLRDAYEIELEHFVDCIDRRCESGIITVEQVREVLCTMEAIRTSLETGEKAEVDYDRQASV